jgi:hypothetical protein
VLAAIATCGLLADCETTPITVPITVPTKSATTHLPAKGEIARAPRHGSSNLPAARTAEDVSQPCTVQLAGVSDTRPDPNELGMMAMRVVRTEDSVSWVRTALDALAQDSRLAIVDDNKNAALVLNVELVKAYILTMNTQKSANVVLRASYKHEGKDLDSEIARGRDTGANWANGAEEAQGAIDRALSAAVSELDNEVVARCRALESERPA